MARVEITENLIEIDGVVRVESGPALRVAVATPELLDNQNTAEHYQDGGFDAVGAPISVGQEMTYLDWMGEPVWYVYCWEVMPPELAAARELPEGSEYWAEKGVRPTQEDAEAFAQSLL